MMRPWFSVWLLAITSLIAEDGDVDEFSRAPYIQQVGADFGCLVWRTENSIDPIVRYGQDWKNLTNSLPESAIAIRREAKGNKELENGSMKPRPLHSPPKGTRQFEATFSGLKPDTRYYYAIYDDDKRLTPNDQSYHFRTAPMPGSKKRAHFWVVGDSGTGEKRQSKVHDAMLDYVKEVNQPIDFCLHLGDMAYSKGTDSQFQRKYFEVYDETLRNTVVWPAMGNHEGVSSNGATGVGPYYDAFVCPTKGEVGGVGSGTEAYYSFDYGRIHFVVLDSFDVDRSGQGVMAQWLKEDLNRVNKADWLIAYWHHPPYTKGSHDSDRSKESIEIRENILPILESHGVDVVLTGHSHIYERSMLMDGAYSTPTVVDQVILDDGDGDPKGDGAYRKLPNLAPHQGTVQVVAGNGGEDVERLGTMPVMKRVIVENGSVLVTIEGNVLKAVMIDFEGGVRDRFQLVKQDGVLVKRLSNPRTLPPYVPPGSSVPKDYVGIIGQGDSWQYHVGATDPTGWPNESMVASQWSTGKMPIGDARAGLKTQLTAMANAGQRLYVTHEFELSEEMDPKRLGIAVEYRDGFIGYVNGHEVVRQGVEKGSGPEAEGIADHASNEDFEFFQLKDVHEHLKPGSNVISFEAHRRHPFETRAYVFNVFLIERLKIDEDTGDQMPWLAQSVLPLGEEWRYSLEQTFEAGWEKQDFDDSNWSEGGTPMSYGIRVESPVRLRNMQGRHTRIRLRREVQLASLSAIETQGMAIGWDDGFIAYVNGHEFGRGHIGRGSGESAIGIGKSSNPKMRYFPFSKVKQHMRVGSNVIAIEGHNSSLESSDYYIGPEMVRPWPNLGQTPPKDLGVLVKPDAEWFLLIETDPKSDWTTRPVLGILWQRSDAPFGRNYRKMGTEFKDMKGKYSRVYIRRNFELKREQDRRGLGIMLAIDDACIVYLNGKEALRLGVGSGRGPEATDLYETFDSRLAYFSLAAFADTLRIGNNVVAIEGHNQHMGSDDFLLVPSLVLSKVEAASYPIPDSAIDLIPKNVEWDYLAGEEPKEDWRDIGAELPGWKFGKAGFGYGDDDDLTVLSDMAGEYSIVRIRHEFEVTSLADVKGLGLAMRWDDGFIANLNGEEVIRVNVRTGDGRDAEGIRTVDAKKKHVGFSLAEFERLLRVGRNVLAIEGHNRDKKSSDFTLDPYLFRAPDWPN